MQLKHLVERSREQELLRVTVVYEQGRLLDKRWLAW